MRYRKGSSKIPGQTNTAPCLRHRSTHRLYVIKPTETNEPVLQERLLAG